jgi:prepilin-type N-terminal cleavage/methylation domain-containing protein/prepilin-type processing-associated H-X9-DG protein
LHEVYELQRDTHYQAKRKVIMRYETSIFMNKRGAFTLIELLVVIAIIALLMGVLMPALMRAKEAGKTIKCQANLRTLTTAWYTYAMDNDDKLCGSWNYNGGGWGDPWDWAWAPWKVDGSSAVSDYFNATDEEKQEGIKKGVLYPYTRSVDCYHCPSDKSFGRNFRTYSMPDSLNGKWANNKGGTANWTDVSHLSQLKNPATKYVLLEENDPRGYNINAWVINPGGIGSMVWSDPLVVWHGSRSSFGFGDGHAETWKWSNETLRIFRDLTSMSQGQRSPSSEDGIRDLERIQRSWPEPRDSSGSG